MNDNDSISLINSSIQTIKQNIILIDNTEIKKQQNKEQYVKALDRILLLLQQHKFTKTKLSLAKPEVEIKGARSIWLNYSKICNQMKMNSVFVNQYFKAQFYAQLLIKNQKMIIIGQRIKSKVLESYLIDFLKQYLICQQCKMAETKLVKNRKTKLISKECKVCKATCTVDESKFKYFKFP
ncbi:unnamed protein product [Paramecium sonneborni]|uniref:Translation initiation factor IF2/IF5 domain-containing protein n=1 Tax=Paramecium sonneborni TaxID=65129 RepID=A0A8S1RB84_9CILI|nr:unnamed protein product [Paramecium sonneborni]